MGAFYEGEVDVLISTTIVESGLDIPNVNTMIVYRADMFGLSQLYQLRGRIGRSKARAYAFLTLPPDKKVTPTAMRRLEVLSRLDTLGAGFSLASHDLDIRGAGNLLGTEQSGHIREVGIELYQQMLEEAVAALRAEREGTEAAVHQTWTPEINVGSAVLIPDDYVRDLDIRLGLYRRIASLEHREDIEIPARRARRPLRRAAGRAREPAGDRRHQGAVPRRRHCQAGCRPARRQRRLPRGQFRQPGRPGRLDRQPGGHGQAAPGHAAGRDEELGQGRPAPVRCPRHRRGAGQHREGGPAGQGGAVGREGAVRPRWWCGRSRSCGAGRRATARRRRHSGHRG